MTTAMLADYSLYAAYSAMLVYVIAFMSFALDLVRRSTEGQMVESIEVDSGGAVQERAGAGQVMTKARDVASVRLEQSRRGGRRSVFERVGISLTTLGLAIHLVSVVLRGVAADRVPWANMFEFSLTGTALIVGIFLLVSLRVDIRFLGTFIVGLILLLLGIALVNYYVPVVPTAPPLQSYWLVIHVFVACLGTAFFALAAGLSIVQLVRGRLGAPDSKLVRLFNTLPKVDKLELQSYRIALMGFVLWTFTLIAGAIWAQRAWGRYWGWDTKEVWTFIIWVLYAGYIHSRATRGWRGNRSAYISLVAFAAVLFNFAVVNVFFHGMHSYSGLTTN